MKISLTRIALCFLILTGLSVAETTNEELINSVREGGFLLAFRHAQKVEGLWTRDGFYQGDDALSELGLNQAEGIDKLTRRRGLALLNGGP